MRTVPVQGISPWFCRVSDKTVWSFVRVQAQDGTIGWGEATVNGAARAIAAEVGRQQAALAGGIASVIDGVRPLTESKVGWAVASAIDQALWDILARQEGRPLAELLRPLGEAESCSNQVTLYANINRGTLDRSPQGFAATARAAVAAGFGAIKMAPFDDLTPSIAADPQGRALIGAGLDRIAAAHAAIGGAARLQVDCHWRFTPETAEMALREAARIGIVWFECPLPETSETIQEVRRLRGIANLLGVQLAGLEESSTVAGFLPWVEAYDVMMPDVKYAGGLAEIFRIAQALASHGVGFSLHNPTGSVCHAASLHVTAALPPGLAMEMQWAETDLLFDLPDPALPRPVGGGSRLPDGPGHGAALNLADLVPEAP